jgi:hypothetical protein
LINIISALLLEKAYVSNHKRENNLPVWILDKYAIKKLVCIGTNLILKVLSTNKSERRPSSNFNIIILSLKREENN